MMTAEVLGLALTAMNHAAELAAIYQKATAEGRADLTPEEVAQISAAAHAAVNRLGAALGAAS